ncbi:MAG: ZIP family metal transporter [Gammaproteobacteria bacterium]|nr:ZIP family metal transporter [Gammaproteobacteria bacterium]|tara:strand:- start:311 stop:1084 length:774 start_codon:yes stop_codon:yes gene_type:complete
MDLLTVLMTLSAASLVSAVALCSAFVLYLKDTTLTRWMPRLIALAVGVLLGDVFLHLLPDALERAPDAGSVFLWTLVGIVLFYFIEQTLHWRHDHAITSDKIAQAPKSYANMNLLGDGAHNFVDGILIAGSFLADPMLGLATTVAIVIHEIPQEISDIAVLIHGGYEKKRAVLANFLCACACLAGAGLTLLVAQFMTISLSALLALTAGGFIYIATSDLIPLLRNIELRLPLRVQAMATIAGIASMQSILWLEMLVK